MVKPAVSIRTLNIAGGRKNRLLHGQLPGDSGQQFMLRIPPRESFAEMLEPGDITRVYYANNLTKQNGKGAKKYCIQCFDRH